ncbi:Geranylgeranyl transferase type-2 subunit alpha [Diplonema papillatum]|nr:Geranylgeranyl transferase type-2 subunit alpha [Diplonema papillatum]
MHDRKREILTDVQKKQMDQKIAVYKGLCGECTELRRRCAFSDGAEKKVEKLLMVNPEFYTMWNYKKETLLHRVEHDRPLVLGSGCVEGVGATREMVTWKWVERELRVAFNAHTAPEARHQVLLHLAHVAELSSKRVGPWLVRVKV